jgi:hypothetical protein
MNRLKATCLVLVALLPGTAAALLADSIIAEDVSTCCAVSSQTVLYARGDSIIGFNPTSTESFGWSMDLDPTEAGWDGTGSVRGLAADGGRVLAFIDLVPPVEEMYGMSIPAPVGVVACAEDGSGARILALTRGPDIRDIELVHGGGYIAGNGWSRSAPDAEHYLDYVTGEMALELLPPSNLISTADGRRFDLPELDLSIEHIWCPHAARVVLERENPTIVLLDTETPAVDSVMAVGDAYPGIDIRRWVAVDALTADYHGTRGLIFTDGRFAPLPGSGWIVYSWLDDGSYIFSMDGGDTLRHGLIDWSTFETSAAPPQPGLGAYVGSGLRPIPGLPTRMIHLAEGVLRLLELTG